jgi:hypothetical protein
METDMDRRHAHPFIRFAAGNPLISIRYLHPTLTSSSSLPQLFF